MKYLEEYYLLKKLENNKAKYGKVIRKHIYPYCTITWDYSTYKLYAHCIDIDYTNLLKNNKEFINKLTQYLKTHFKKYKDIESVEVKKVTVYVVFYETLYTDSFGTLYLGLANGGYEYIKSGTLQEFARQLLYTKYLQYAGRDEIVGEPPCELDIPIIDNKALIYHNPRCMTGRLRNYESGTIHIEFKPIFPKKTCSSIELYNLLKKEINKLGFGLLALSKDFVEYVLKAIKVNGDTYTITIKIPSNHGDLKLTKSKTKPTISWEKVIKTKKIKIPIYCKKDNTYYIYETNVKVYKNIVTKNKKNTQQTKKEELHLTTQPNLELLLLLPLAALLFKNK